MRKRYRVVLLSLLLVVSAGGPLPGQSFMEWRRTGEQYPTCGYFSNPDAELDFTQYWETWGRLVCADGRQTTYDFSSPQLTAKGACGLQESNPGQPGCVPDFQSPRTSVSGGQHVWRQDATSKAHVTFWPFHSCYRTNGVYRTSYARQRSLNDPFCPPMCYLDPTVCWDSGGEPDYANCTCRWSPIIVDTEGNGYALTDAANGVNFDLKPDGVAERVAWTARDGDDGFLVLDRNGNGRIDDGSELFGTFSDQPGAAGERNGFRALAVFDLPDHGGDGDGAITASDEVYRALRVWLDHNHDGVSTPAELVPLAELGIRALDLQYQESRRRDQYGNVFRFRARIDGIRGARWAYDVFLATVNSAPTTTP